MKLLSREDIAKQKSSERKSEVDEGIKLARKIDVLRETASNEETKLSKFRAEGLKQLKEDIDGLMSLKTALERDVQTLYESIEVAKGKLQQFISIIKN